MRSVSVTLELLVPGHTANAVLDFLLDTFVSPFTRMPRLWKAWPSHSPDRVRAS